METKDKKSVANYYTIETRDLRSGTPEWCYWDWDEIDRRDNLDEAKAEYEKRLATHDTLRLVQVTFTTVAQSYKTPRFIGELEQSLNEVEERIYKYLVKFLKNVDLQDYTCDIQLTNGDMVTEMILDADREAIEVVICGPDEHYSCELGLLSTEDRLTILKAVAENQ